MVSLSEIMSVGERIWSQPCALTELRNSSSYEAAKPGGPAPPKTDSFIGGSVISKSGVSGWTLILYVTAPAPSEVNEPMKRKVCGHGPATAALSTSMAVRVTLMEPAAVVGTGFSPAAETMLTCA